MVHGMIFRCVFFDKYYILQFTDYGNILFSLIYVGYYLEHYLYNTNIWRENLHSKKRSPNQKLQINESREVTKGHLTLSITN